MKIRIEGTLQELKDAEARLWLIYKVTSASKPYKNRNSELHRVYVNVEHYQDDPLLDPTGVRLTPSHHGKDCLGNGEHPGIECCCDECGWYLECWPDWRELNENA